MSDPLRPESLQELARICLSLKLIDKIEKQGETVVIVRQGVVRFRLKTEQAEAFLYRLIDHKIARGDSLLPNETSAG